MQGQASRAGKKKTTPKSGCENAEENWENCARRDQLRRSQLSGLVRDDRDHRDQIKFVTTVKKRLGALNHF